MTVSKYGVISGPYFPAFGLNTERYQVFLRIQSECRKIRTRNNSIFGQFSRSVYTSECISFLDLCLLCNILLTWNNLLLRVLLVDEGDLVFVTKQRYGSKCGINVVFSTVGI